MGNVSVITILKVETVPSASTIPRTFLLADVQHANVTLTASLAVVMILPVTVNKT
jgi:hypothetical protein